MRRYTTLLLTAFLLLAIVIAGSAYLATPAILTAGRACRN